MERAALQDRFLVKTCSLGNSPRSDVAGVDLQLHADDRRLAGRAVVQQTTFVV